MNGAAVPFAEGDVTDHDGRNSVSLSFGKTMSSEWTFVIFAGKCPLHSITTSLLGRNCHLLILVVHGKKNEKALGVCA